MDLRTRTLTVSGEQLMELLQAAFAEGVTQGAVHGTAKLDAHPVLSGDVDAAAQWCLDLVERTVPDIWLTAR